jgi:hypothetical protein
MFTKEQYLEMILDELGFIGSKESNKFIAYLVRRNNNMTNNIRGSHRSGVGPKTKAEKGQQKYKVLNVTLPPDLWKAVENSRLDGEKTSHLIARLLELAIREIVFLELATFKEK